MRLRYIRRIIADLLFVPLVLFCIWRVELLTYALRMAKGQLTIVWNARPVSEVLADAAVPDSVKTKLRLIEEIRQFAFDSIGLKPSGNYTTFYDQKGKRLIYVVTASDPYALRPHTWKFPVLGEVPYKGFFDKQKAQEEWALMRSKGLDADIGGASGWSTLGWFKDPVLSQMLYYSEGDLAELIIHELTHGTIFIPDSVEYNENLASFIGYKGALWFLESKYGKDSPQYTHYISGHHDETVLDSFMLSCSRRADSLYRGFGKNLLPAEKKKQKAQLFESFVENARKLPLETDSLFPARFRKKLVRSGNTYLLQFVRYGSKQKDFEQEYSAFANLRQFLDSLKKRYGI
jgi:predicted aminopeptidase